MLYIFRVVGTDYVKLGFTRGDPWKRAATGFWSNVHPPACCGRLAWEDLELVALFSGSLPDEAAVQRVLPPAVGEFWLEEELDALLRAVGALCEELPAPPKPDVPPEVARRTEKLPCCGAPRYICGVCSASFQREHHVWQHRESCEDRRVSCSACHKKVLKRNLKRHLRKRRAQKVAAAFDSE